MISKVISQTLHTATGDQVAIDKFMAEQTKRLKKFAKDNKLKVIDKTFKSIDGDVVYKLYVSGLKMTYWSHVHSCPVYCKDCPFKDTCDNVEAI